MGGSEKFEIAEKWLIVDCESADLPARRLTINHLPLTREINYAKSKKPTFKITHAPTTRSRRAASAAILH